MDWFMGSLMPRVLSFVGTLAGLKALGTDDPIRIAHAAIAAGCCFLVGLILAVSER